eukprot:12531374-Prorocentrum_lima.AAC.1
MLVHALPAIQEAEGETPHGEASEPRSEAPGDSGPSQPGAQENTQQENPRQDGEGDPRQCQNKNAVDQLPSEITALDQDGAADYIDPKRRILSLAGMLLQGPWT